ncbi:spore coat protein CotS, partial [Bacillus wiedmannii]
GLKNEKAQKVLPKQLYKREISRLFGNAEFDIAIDFSGYVPFWTLLFAFGDFKKRSIYQHNDMWAEYSKKIKGKFKHRANLNIIFPLYKEFDKIVAVAEHTRNLN